MSEPRPPSDGRHWTAWIPALVAACVVFALSSIPGQRIPALSIPHIDKVAHACIYSVLGGTIALGLHKGYGIRSMTRIVLTSMALGAVYGATDEIHQLWTPHRSFELLDALADLIGSLLGSIAYVSLRLIRRRSA